MLTIQENRIDRTIKHLFNEAKRLTSRTLQVLTLAGLTAATSAHANADQTFGQITTFSQVPATPGFPEGIAVEGNRVFVSGPARFGTAGTGPSTIQVYNRKSGHITQTIAVQGESLAFEHALSNVAIDGDGDVYALSTQLGVLRFSKQGQSYVQSSYGAPLPDLLPLPGTFVDFPPIPNDLVFDDAGYLYVTDSLQGTIFRYSPNGGQPQVWFQSELLLGGGFLPFGANGLRLDPSRQWMYVVSTTSLD
ncbi:MAG: hypothetical protein ABL921_19830, partial [Pirellula sp.]